MVFCLAHLKLAEQNCQDKLYKLSKINIATVTNAKSGLSSSLPVTFIIMIVLYVIAYLILNYTMAGRSVYAVGGDEVSAQRAGINVGKSDFWYLL